MKGPMKLAIVIDGQVFDIVDNLDEYDLTKRVACIDICDSISREVKRIREHE